MADKAKFKVCHECEKPITFGGPYRLRLVLANAAKGAPKQHTDVEYDFDAECAARIFRRFRGGTA